MPKLIDLTGQRFGRLTVLERDCMPRKGVNVCWICICDCGNYTSVPSNHLRSGATQSCGCIHHEMMVNRQQRHGFANTRIYRIWTSMKSRCYNDKNKRYKYYGGRGIGICDEWKRNFKSFYDWAIANGYSEDLSIDRIDVDGNYEPSNCRWATIKEQANNRSTSHLITAFGQTKTMKEWAEFTGINYFTLSTRLRSGLSPEEALRTKIAT